MDGFTVLGGLGFMACEVDGGSAGRVGSFVDVGGGVPALYAVIGDVVSGRVLDPSVAQLTVTGPDGRVYDAGVNTAAEFAVVSSGWLQALVVLGPAAGAGEFRAMLATVPVAGAESDPLGGALAALAPRFAGDTSGSAELVGFELLRWGMWPLAVVVVAARGVAGLVLDLAGLVSAAFGVDGAAAGRAVAGMAGQAAPGALLTIAREGGLVPPGAAVEVLVNGAAADGLAGWQVTDNGGAGWAVQSGYSGGIGYGDNFAASYGWCRKQQVIDLVGQAGLTADFLDGGPVVTVTDWVAAPVPGGADGSSQYQLTAGLLDASGAVVKEVTTGAVVPAPGWQRVQFTFAGYGPGVRSVLFAHGGVDGGQWGAGYGVKLTGAGVSVQLAGPGYVPAELMVNGSGQDGMTGWADTSPSGDPWAVDAGAGVACPASPGGTAFAVASGTGVKQQVVDLVAAGLRPDFLDTSPLLQAGQWVAASPAVACGYGFTAELLDGQQNVIGQVASGTVHIASGPLAFSPLIQTISGYPAGLRSVRFTQTAQPAAAATGAAFIAGTTLQILLPQPPQTQPEAEQDPEADTPMRRAVADAAATSARPVYNPPAKPYWWVCRLNLYPLGGGNSFDASGALISVGRNFVILTVAHNMLQWSDQSATIWIASIAAQPGPAGRNPYSQSTATGMALQFPIEYLLHNQGVVSYDRTFDYGAVLMSAGSNWEKGGFVLTTEDDAAMQGQAVTVTGFPGNQPFIDGTMYTEDVTVSIAADPTQGEISSTFNVGASGSPVYVRGTDKVVGVYVRGSLFGYGARYFRRLDAQAIANVQRWSRALAPGDRVCSLQLVIHTGNQPMAGTDDPIGLTLDGHVIPLDPLWMAESGSAWKAKESGHFDGYDLSLALRDTFPDGLTVASLSGKAYQLRQIASSIWPAGGWNVESLTWYVNGQRYHLHNPNTFLYFERAGWDVISDTLP
jgi:hypothetical protein